MSQDTPRFTTTIGPSAQTDVTKCMSTYVELMTNLKKAGKVCQQIRRSEICLAGLTISYEEGFDEFVMCAAKRVYYNPNNS